MIKLNSLKKLSLLTVIISLSIVSCSKENIEEKNIQSTDKHELYGLPNSVIIQERENLDGEVLLFDNTEEIKKYFEEIDIVSASPSEPLAMFENIKSTKTSENPFPLTITQGDNVLLMICPPVFLQEYHPCVSNGGGGIQSSGCGAGTMRLSKEASTGTNYNVRLVYDFGEDGTLIIKEVSSFISGLTYGWTYQQHTVSIRVESNNDVVFEIDGTTAIDVGIGGAGDLTTRPTLLAGRYNPCSGGGGGLQEILYSYEDSHND